MKNKKENKRHTKNYTSPKAKLVPLKTQERLFGTPGNGNDASPVR